MNILFVVSEADPFAKTGGLADVGSALPKALAALGHDVRIVLPLYRQINRERFALRPTAFAFGVPVGPRTHQVRIWDTLLPAPPTAGPTSRVPVYFVECAALFDRDGLYQDRGQDFPDNLERFSCFSQAALQCLARLGWQPDIIHAHDWQSALACAHLRFGAIGQEKHFASTATVFTIHNLAYQGLFASDQWPLTHLPPSAFAIDGLEFYGKINCLKGGLVSAASLTTVSPTYAREILTTEFGCGLEGVLRARSEDLVGILNGIDVEEWNPERDPHLAATYAAERMAGKALCKLALQRAQHLPERQDLLIGMIQRLAEQKGIDLFVQAIDELMTLPVQVVMLGTGDPAYHQQLQVLAERFPDRLAVNLKFDNALAHQIEAGSDAFLMPSRFEPCGLNQLYSLRYGTVPIVKRVGGLADTVADVSPQTMAAQAATGFVFADHTPQALIEAVRRAVAAFRDHALWAQLVRNGMRQDGSWNRSARAYLQVYERALRTTVQGSRYVR